MSNRCIPSLWEICWMELQMCEGEDSHFTSLSSHFTHILLILLHPNKLISGIPDRYIHWQGVDHRQCFERMTCHCFVVCFCPHIEAAIWTTLPIQRERCAVLFQLPDVDWGTGKQGVVDSAFFWGYLVTQIPGGFLASKWPPNRSALPVFCANFMCANFKSLS